MEPQISFLGRDPPNTKCRLNACSYQQDALTTYDGWQYATFYTTPSGSKSEDAPRHVNLSRRPINTASSKWENIEFTDYKQTTDDGHNTISLGISYGDGTIHMAYDHHCDQLRLRSSVVGLARDHSVWNTSMFYPTIHYVPGILSSEPPFKDVSYPRFCNIGMDLLLEYRVGKAGSGSNVLYHYSSTTHTWRFLGQYLTGISSNPYPNALTHKRGRLHVSWTYRHFISYPGSHDPDSTAHKAQAGPNGPENNADLCYAFSDDQGRTWENTRGKAIADLSRGESILPTSKDITVFEIPKGSGVLNQEGQCADAAGGFHVLNRQYDHEGKERWWHYFRGSAGSWERVSIPDLEPTEAGDRGDICADGNSDVYFLLPGNGDTSLTLMKATRSGGWRDHVVVWRGEGWAGEPLVDEPRLRDWGVLLVFTRTAGMGGGGRRVAVLDFDLGREVACAGK